MRAATRLISLSRRSYPDRRTPVPLIASAAFPELPLKPATHGVIETSNPDPSRCNADHIIRCGKKRASADVSSAYEPFVHRVWTAKMGLGIALRELSTRCGFVDKASRGASTVNVDNRALLLVGRFLVDVRFARPGRDEQQAGTSSGEPRS